MIKAYDSASLNTDLSEGSVILEFFSATCGPCKMLGFMLQDLDKTFGDDITIIQIPFEDNPDLVKEYGVEGYPTMVFFKDGEEVNRRQGLVQKPVLTKLIKELI